VGGITYGQRVRVIAKQDGWAQIENPAGWCSERYIEYESNGNGGSSPTTATFAICLASGLNVRSGPAATFPVVGGLVYGQRAKVMQRENGWAQLENPAGWGSESYLRIESSNA
jgi:probable enterotoxin D